MINYGMFLMPVHDPSKAPEQSFDEDLELVVRCEELGFTEFWVGEHHSSSYENIVMPEIFIGKALGMTKSIRMGAAPICLPYHHPAHVASRLAFLDHLSHGRLNVCFGPGAIPTDFEMYGIDPRQAGAMVGESIEMIMKLWSSDPPYKIDGRFWNIHVEKEVRTKLGLGVYLKPLQKPHPPVSVPVVNRNSAGTRIAGEKGYSPFSHHMVAGNVMQNHWEVYSEGAALKNITPDRKKWKISRNIFVSETTTDAKNKARHGSMGQCLDYILQLSDLGPGRGMWKRDPETPDADVTLDYLLKDQVIAGDPEEVVRQLLEMRDETGDFGTLVMVAHDWDDKEACLRSIELFSREVMPLLNEAVP
ncbi:MAG: LLM class flavin-dependent oxidoreductase [Candidatus Latescibacteria bacterium]|jgi:alkanesulfonate monooxygenase SsuD/methylene tetrahydromethanopterin reductase-like flavin-dependent oxidoreductase (luciferase family)|nr:LLM class flavin-dependent oxidoreductase [Candidatus Latescibacterota bacterium]